jgi:hypothetical protein
MRRAWAERSWGAGRDFAGLGHGFFMRSGARILRWLEGKSRTGCGFLMMRLQKQKR